MSRESLEPVEEYTEVESVFVRRRNCLLLRGQFTPVFTGYYLHLMERNLRHTEKLDSMLKDMLAVLGLHLAARPRNETIAWTANLRAPRANLFATGSSMLENLVGRVFTEDVREPDRNLLYSQAVVSGREPRTSSVDLETNDPVEWIERFYRQSEQRPARCFRLEDENYVLVAAQPDYDEDWLGGLDIDKTAAIPEDEETSLLETRRFRYFCGCGKEQILATLAAWKGRTEELFHGEESIVAKCPRCGARYRVDREELE